MYDENMSLIRRAPTAEETSTRRVLANVSPNVKSNGPARQLPDKAKAGSPLKRTFTAAMSGNQGFTYLKRRKTSSYEAPVHNHGDPVHPVHQLYTPASSLNAASLQLLDDSDFRALSAATPQPSPTEVDTLPGSIAGDDEDDNDPSAEHRSFSSLINYDPSSQNAPAFQQSTKLVVDGPSHAELLKLRLRVAMYKVRTGQINVPFSELSEARAEPAVQVCPSPTRTPPKVLPTAFNLDPRQPILNLMPAPVLRPTAYSSRMIYDLTVPSSPPDAASPEKLPEAVSTPYSAQRFTMPDEAELTSSIVKGRVAEGLLDLRNGM